MTDWVEASGKTLEEAREAAATELGVPADEVEFEVIEEGAKGLFGLGQPKVHIRARAAGTSAGEDAGQDASAGSDAGGDASKGQKAVTMLEQVFEAMNFQAHATLLSEDDQDVEIDINGDSEDIGRLIGRNGQTLDALQYLVGIGINRGDPYKIRVSLDAEGYRERHRQMLEAKALAFAAKVVESGNEAVFEPQSARDRRIVHMSLADHPDVSTYSEGDGDDRHVVISPKR